MKTLHQTVNDEGQVPIFEPLYFPPTIKDNSKCSLCREQIKSYDIEVEICSDEKAHKQCAKEHNLSYKIDGVWID
jgi:hypothetical protein